jgi:hypothetical protein
MFTCSHGHHHHARSIRGFGSDVSAVAIEPVVQKLRCRLLRCKHRLGSVEINGIVAAKHGLSTEVRLLLKLPYGFGTKREVGDRHCEC